MLTPFRIDIAGQIVEIHPLFSYVEKMCAGYITRKDADIIIEISPEDIAAERVKVEANNKLIGENNSFSDAYLETLAVYRKIAEAMIDRDTLLFHGSALALDGEGYLFAAVSGTGKSTHARLWREKFGGRVTMINDDKPLLRLTSEGVFVCGTPWDGKHRLSSSVQIPLKALCILERDTYNHVEPVSSKEALPYILNQSYQPTEPEKLAKVLEIIDRITKTTALYKLGCNMEPEAAEISCVGMGGKIYEA